MVFFVRNHLYVDTGGSVTLENHGKHIVEESQALVGYNHEWSMAEWHWKVWSQVVSPIVKLLDIAAQGTLSQRRV